MPRARPQGATHSVILETLKLLHGQALSRQQIRRQLGFAEDTVHYVCRELEAQGFLVSRPGPDVGAKGHIPLLFTVAPAWGGKAP